MTKSKILLLTALTLMIAVIFSGCKKKTDDPITGDALFTYETTGYEVAFTNTSTVEGTYMWEFGDDATSTEKNPVHTYSGKGEYTVKLTVSDENGDPHSISTKINIDKYSPVKTDDGTLSDWDNVNDNVIVPTSVVNGGIIQKVKIDYDADYIYVYVEATRLANDENYPIFHDIMFDTDLDTTGFISGAFWPNLGAEILCENTFETDPLIGAVIKHVGPGHGWTWEDVQGVDLVTLGYFETISDSDMFKYEISYKRTIPGLSNDAVKLSIFNMNPTWNVIGWAPDKTNLEAGTEGVGFVLNMN